MNKKAAILIGSVVLVMAVLAGCVEAPEGSVGVSKTATSSITVVPICNDHTVCYEFNGGYAGGLSCHRDAGLVEKYCGDDQPWWRNETNPKPLDEVK